MKKPITISEDFINHVLVFTQKCLYKALNDGEFNGITIIQFTSLYWKDLTLIQSKHRYDRLVFQRALISYYLVRLGLTYSEVGGIINKDHSTVVHYMKHGMSRMKTSNIINEVYVAATREIERTYKSSNVISRELEQLREERQNITQRIESLEGILMRA